MLVFKNFRYKKIIIVTILCVLIVLVLGVFGYSIVKNKLGGAKTETPKSETTEPETAQHLSYQGPYLNFKYPKGWEYLVFDDGKSIYLLNQDILAQTGKDWQVERDDLFRSHLDEENIVPVLKIRLIDVKYNDPAFVLENFGGNIDYENRNKIKFEDKQIGEKIFKYIKYDTPIPEEMKPYLEEMEKKAKSTGAPDNVYMGEYDYYFFPQCRVYYYEFGKYSLVASLASLDAEKYEADLVNIISTLNFQEPKVEYKIIKKNGLSFSYPTNWLIEDEWTGRNDNLGEVDIEPQLTPYESTQDKTIRIYIRKIGTSIKNQIAEDWEYTDVLIDGHNGKRYQYNGSRMYEGEVAQESILVSLNKDYEIFIWGENSEINKYILNEVIKSIKVDLSAINEVVKEIVRTSPYVNKAIKVAEGTIEILEYDPNNRLTIKEVVASAKGDYNRISIKESNGDYFDAYISQDIVFYIGPKYEDGEKLDKNEVAKNKNSYKNAEIFYYLDGNFVTAVKIIFH